MHPADPAPVKLPGTTRGPEQIRRHYEIERELADRLRNAGPEERVSLYTTVYDELFERVPDHPQLTGPRTHASFSERQLQLLKLFLSPGQTFLEVGAGDCALAIRAAPLARQVYALDVSREIMPSSGLPENVELVVSDGRNVPLPAGVVDVAYSNQLIEHLHPDDARHQLTELLAALSPGGVYVCITPHRFAGPHDVSKFYDEEATGLHLKEYTNAELQALFLSVGFSRVVAVLDLRVIRLKVPLWIPLAVERALAPLPAGLRRRLASSPLRKLLGVSVAAIKSRPGV